MNTEKMLYIHPGPVRFWHWLNAAGIVLLVVTGFQIRYAENLNLLPLKEAISLHNYAGFAVITAYFLWLYYYLSTGKITIYFPKLSTFAAKALAQGRFYGYGIFHGEANPHVMTPENKFNVLQQKAYLAIMFVLLPAQMASGIFLWKIKGYSDYINLLGGIRVIATIHVLFFFFFASFLVVHCYLASLGHTPLAHFKAMITGYEEHH